MNDPGTLPRHMLDVRELTAEAFAPYGQVVAPLRTGGQGAETGYDPEASASEAKLVLGNGEPRLWLMHLPHVGLGFTRIARHRRVTQCLGSLGGKEWLIGVAPPGHFSDDARPRLEDIVAFRVPGDSGQRLDLRVIDPRLESQIVRWQPLEAAAKVRVIHQARRRNVG